MRVHGLDMLLESSPGRGFIIISPFTRWASKNWSLQYFIQTASLLCKKYTVLITGAAGDREKITAGLSELDGDENIINLAGALNLAELGELMSHAKLVISGDSFPMHLATAVGVPLLTLFGPTDERKTGPRSANSIVLRPEDCQRCDRPDCARACLGQISVSQVETAAMRLLS